MSETVLTIRQKLMSGGNREAIGSPKRLDLSARRGRRYIFPKALHEYQKYNVILTLETDGVPLNVQPSADASKANVQRIDETRFRYRRKLFKEARQGVAKDRLVIFLGSASYHLSILIPLEGEALDRHQYDLMLEDISHWLHTSLHRRTEHELAPETEDVSDEGLRADIETFYRIQRYVNDLDDVLKRISSSPEEEIKNVYQQTHGDSLRQDARTLRWNETRSGIPESLTYSSTHTHDVYENRFILFLLHQLDKILVTVKNSAVKTEEKFTSTLQKTKRLYKQHNRTKSQLRDARKDHKRSQKILDEICDLRRQVRKMGRYPFLREVSYNPSQFQVSLPLTLTQEVSYARVFSIYRNLRQDSRLRQLTDIGQFVEGINSLGVERTSKIYEYWTFFATYRMLLDLGFEDDSGSGLIEMINQETLTPGLVSGESVNLRYQSRDETSSQTRSTSDLSGVSLNLYYEKPFWNGRSKQGNPAACPDITLEVYQRDQFYQGRHHLCGRFILDAKYKTKKDSKNRNFTDAKKQARRHQAKRVGGAIRRGMGAFFLHLDPNEREFDDASCTKGEKKWLGYLPVLPDDTDALEVLLERDFLGQRIPQFLT